MDVKMFNICQTWSHFRQNRICVLTQSSRVEYFTRATTKEAEARTYVSDCLLGSIKKWTRFTVMLSVPKDALNFSTSCCCCWWCVFFSLSSLPSEKHKHATQLPIYIYIYTYIGPWAQPINYFHFQFITAIFPFVWCPTWLTRYACVIFYVFRIFATLNTRPTALILMIVNVPSGTRFRTYRFRWIIVHFPTQCVITKIQAENGNEKSKSNHNSDL